MGCGRLSFHNKIPIMSNSELNGGEWVSTTTIYHKVELTLVSS